MVYIFYNIKEHYLNEIMYITDANDNRYKLLEITSSENEVNAKFIVSKQILDEGELYLNITKEKLQKEIKD